MPQCIAIRDNVLMSHEFDREPDCTPGAIAHVGHNKISPFRFQREARTGSGHGHALWPEARAGSGHGRGLQREAEPAAAMVTDVPRLGTGRRVMMNPWSFRLPRVHLHR